MARKPKSEQQPNEYTKAYAPDASGAPDLAQSRPLENPVKKQTPDMGSYQRFTSKRHQSRAAEFDAARTGRKVDLPGYGTVDMDSTGWNLGDTPVVRDSIARSNRPGIARGPAINEPHASSPDVMVGRRQEDLSQRELDHGTEVMSRYGATSESVKRGILDANDRADYLTMAAEYSDSVADTDARFGPTGMASKTQIAPLTADLPTRYPAGTGFYGGPSEVDKQFTSVAQSLEGRAQDSDHARAMAAAALSATSPRNTFEVKGRDGAPSTFPNVEAARAAGDIAGMPEAEGRAALKGRGAIGIHGNVVKGAQFIERMEAGERYSDVFSSFHKAPKTGPFGSGMVRRSDADSYRTSDVLSTQSSLPHTSTAKSHSYTAVDRKGAPILNEKGKEQRFSVEAEDSIDGERLSPQVARMLRRDSGIKGAQFSRTRDEKNKPVYGTAPAEEMLAKTDYTGHAIMDRAGREAAVERGLTPSVNHAQAQHSMQEVDWRDKQIARDDMTDYTVEGEYPGIGRLQKGVESFDAFAAIRPKK